MRKPLILLNALLTMAAFCTGSERLHAQNNNVYTYHYGNARIGADLNETILTPANVNQNEFGKLFAHKVDGGIYAQPLYVAQVPIAGIGTRNVVYVATEHGSVYAWDADKAGGANGYPLWQTSVTNTANGISSLAGATNPAEVLKEVCITGTPVIDPSTNAMYFVAQTYDVVNGVGTYNQRLHALDIRSGAELSPFPILISASVPGTERIPGNTTCVFKAADELQRAALVLSKGTIYIGWCGITEDGRHGWLLAYNALGYGGGKPGALAAAFCTTPNAGLGGIWGSGNGLAADDSGDIYTITGNGLFDGSTTGGQDWSQTVLKFSTLSGLTIVDTFTPYNNVALSNIDSDFGSGGPVLLPDEAGSTQHPHLMLACGKEGRLYLLDRDNLGGFNATIDNVVQEIPGANEGLWSSPAYWNDGTHGYVYFNAKTDYLKQFTLDNGLLSVAPIAMSSTLEHYPGATPTVSANGTKNGVLWLLQTDGYHTEAPAILHAYDATNVASELYNSAQAGTRDTASPPVKFAVPVVANGKVYIGTKTSLDVYGLLPGPAPTVVTAAAANPSTVTGKSTALAVLGADTVLHGGEASLTYTWSTTGTPPGSVQFSVNGTNAAKSTTATFAAPGAYALQCTITSNTGQSITSAVTVKVVQSAVVTTVLPSSAALFLNATQAFKATGIDQFGSSIPSTAAWKWYLDTGSVGSVNKSEVYGSGASAGKASARAEFNSAGSAAIVTVTVSTAPPTVANPAACTPNPITGTTATLTTLGADANGKSSISYKWSFLGTPPGKVSYSTNGNNTAKTTTVTFGKPGVYKLFCTLTGASGATTTTNALTVTVNASS